MKKIGILTILAILSISQICFANITVDIKGKKTILSGNIDYSQLDTQSQTQVEKQLKAENNQSPVLFGPTGLYSAIEKQ